MTASFIPVFTDYMRNRSREETWKFANRLSGLSRSSWPPHRIVRGFFSSRGPSIFHVREESIQVEAIYLNRLMFPYILFIGMAALAMAILNCFHIFGLPAATPILLNISFIRLFRRSGMEAFFESRRGSRGRVLVGGIFSILPASASTGVAGG